MGTDDEEDEIIGFLMDFYLQYLYAITNRNARVKVMNYINFSRQYSCTDFLMHYRLNRGTSYELLQRFQDSNKFRVMASCIDGSHIRIDKSKIDGDVYYNEKRFFSIHFQGVVDHQKKFLYVLIGFLGSVHNAQVFKESDLPTILSTLCTDGIHFLGDSAYPCRLYLIVPYRDNRSLTRRKRMFNTSLSKCLVVVEAAFGALIQRFRQLYICKIRNIPRLVQFICACCILHNLANSNDLELFEFPEEDNCPFTLNQSVETVLGYEEDYSYERDGTGYSKRDYLLDQLFLEGR